MKTVNEQLGMKYLRHSLSVLKLSRAEARRMAGFLQDDVIPVMEERLKETLVKFKAGKITDRVQIQRLQASLKDLDAQLSLAMMKIEGKTLDRLKTIGEEEVRWNRNTLKDTVPLDIDILVPSASVIHKVVESQVIQGRKLQTWLKSFSATTQNRIMKSTKIGIAAGESIPQIGRRIRGVLRTSKKRAEWLARTTVSETVTNVRNEVFKENANLLLGVQWVSTLDTRTTEYCIQQDGKVFPVDDGPRPPGHFNCRSTIVPIVKSWEQYGLRNPPAAVRASMNGYVPDKTQYLDWLTKFIGAKPGSLN